MITYLLINTDIREFHRLTGLQNTLAIVYEYCSIVDSFILTMSYSIINVERLLVFIVQG